MCTDHHNPFQSFRLASFWEWALEVIVSFQTPTLLPFAANSKTASKSTNWGFSFDTLYDYLRWGSTYSNLYHPHACEFTVPIFRLYFVSISTHVSAKSLCDRKAGKQTAIWKIIIKKALWNYRWNLAPNIQCILKYIQKVNNILPYFRHSWNQDSFHLNMRTKNVCV